MIVGTAVAKLRGLDALGQFGHFFLRAGAASSRFAHHHPAHIVEHGFAGFIEAARAHIDDAGLLVGILLQPDDFGDRIQRGARVDGLEKPAIGIAKIGNRIERDIRHGLAEHHVEHQQIVERRARVADFLCERRRTIALQNAHQTTRCKARHRRRSPCAAWRGGSAGRGGNPRKNCRDLFSGQTARSQIHSFIRSCPATPFSQNREPNASLRQRETDEDVFGPVIAKSATSILEEDIR